MTTDFTSYRTIQLQIWLEQQQETKMTEDKLAKIKAVLAEESSDEQDIRIVILQRGWVVVGRYSQSGTQCKLRNGHVIRCWGTSEGLGQLATEGPLAETKLETTPEIEFHELTVIASIKCNKAKWKKVCPECQC